MQATLLDLFLSFLKLGLTAFSGPAMVAYIRELAVQKKRDGLTKEPSTKGLPLPR